MTRHRIISSIHKLALGTLKFLALAFGTLASIAIFCSCRSSDIATREYDTLNRMQETIQDIGCQSVKLIFYYQNTDMSVFIFAFLKPKYLCIRE